VKRVLSGLIALALWACSKDAKRGPAAGGDSAAAPSAAAPTAERPQGACGYISEADASSALDQPSTFRPHAPTSQTCALAPASGDAFRGVSVDFRVSQGTTRMYDFLAAQKQSEAVGGAGDRARWLPAGETRGNLVVVKGPYELALTISDFSGAGNLKERARAFAKKVLEQL
jgi:hypothetical protein